jgi:hypothetical protein|tara:strand:- start:159 stop:338 length:180 start_codon:yes stop_codon:yes gene_type:complete
MHFAALIFMVGAGGLASVLEVGVAEQTKAQELLEDDGEEPAPNTSLNSINRPLIFAAHA